MRAWSAGGLRQVLRRGQERALIHEGGLISRWGICPLVLPKPATRS